MRFALLGADAQTLAVIRAIQANPQHAIVAAFDVGPWADAVAGAATISEDWELLLSGDVADAVLASRGGPDEVRADQLRRLVQAAVPLLVSHPVDPSMLVYYELDMIRRESGALLAPLAPARLHPAIARMRSWLDDGDLEGLEQIVFERSAAGRSRQEVLDWFAHDVDLARALCGELTKVSALSPTGVGSQADYANLGVQLSGPAQVAVRWSVGPVGERPGAQMQVTGRVGKASLFIPATDDPWVLSLRAEGRPQEEAFDDWRPGVAALANFVAATQGASPQPDWLDACRSLELADAIDHSLSRGRTVEVHLEEPTEHATFKGLMSGVGCFLLIGALLFTIGASLAVKMGVPGAHHWPKMMLAILVAFLLLQLFKFAFPPER